MRVNISIEDLRERIAAGECSDPLVLLESIVKGIDPRQTSKIYDLLMEIEEFNGEGEISPADWAEIRELILEEYRYCAPTLDQSIVAAKELSNYLHPKKKQVDTTNKDESEKSANNPLTEEEIQLFKEVFNDEF